MDRLAAGTGELGLAQRLVGQLEIAELAPRRGHQRVGLPPDDERAELGRRPVARIEVQLAQPGDEATPSAARAEVS